MSGSFCPSCGAAISAANRFCPSCGESVEELTSAPTRTAAAQFAGGPATPSQSSDGGRFLPGQILAERYRVIGLLGRGGMGEVYRADDLKLGEPVALKFLPEAFSRDPGRLDRFFNEVRTARRVTHPNVCRVHDLGEVDGHHFLSMEYVDGEDLGTLLRRIGHVPKDKAIQIARQLCAGVAAAHDEGILHRDLKPANIMIDGRGRARITDFGLAGLAESIEGGEILAGTPAYQAPEQLAGTEVSTASDIYALGLVLYEVFTGTRAFKASSAAELREMQQSATLVSLTSQVEGLDDSIERIIHRCLDPDPRKRPASALAVSAALPGGDPLAAALAAGETPSPGMVADAGDAGGLKPWIAVTLLAVALAGLSLDYVYRTRYSSLALVGLPRSPTDLRLEAGRILDTIDSVGAAHDSEWLFDEDDDYISWVQKNDDSEERWADLASVLPRPFYFWYRQSPSWMKSASFDLEVKERNPVPSVPGSALVRFDAEGRLLGLHVVPPAAGSAADVETFDWTPLLEETGLDPASLTETTALSNPLINCGHQSAWAGTYPDQPDIPIRVEACTSGGSPIYLEVLPPWSKQAIAVAQVIGESVSDTPAQDRTGRPIIVLSILFFCILTGAGFLARRNLRLGRADRRGAYVVAAVVFTLTLAKLLLDANHGPAQEEFNIVLQLLSRALLAPALSWLFYIAVEPFVRKVWPHIIIGWQRLLEGRWRDPRVGRDLLLGFAAAQIMMLARLDFLVVRDPSELISGGSLYFISGSRRWVVAMLDWMNEAFLPTLIVTVFVVLLRILLRKDWLAILVPTAVMVTLISVSAGVGPWFSFKILCIWLPVFFILVRFGLLALTAGALVGSTVAWVKVWDPSAWFFPYVLTSAIVLGLLLFYAFFISMGEKKFFREEMLDG